MNFPGPFATHGISGDLELTTAERPDEPLRLEWSRDGKTWEDR